MATSVSVIRTLPAQPGRRASYTVPATDPTDEVGAARLAVTDLVTGNTRQLPGAIDRLKGNDQSAWLHDFWFLAITDNTLRILDVQTNSLHEWHGIRATRITTAQRAKPRYL